MVKCVLCFCLAFMGALASADDVADKEVDDLVKICENHHSREGLTKGPIAVDLDSTTVMLRRVSLYLDHGQCGRVPVKKEVHPP